MLFPGKVAQSSVWRKVLQPLGLVPFVPDRLDASNQKISSLGTVLSPGLLLLFVKY